MIFDRHNMQPASIKLIEYGVIEIEDQTGARMLYAQNYSGVLEFGQIIHYTIKVNDVFADLAMFVPAAPYSQPWVLGVKTS